MPGALHTSHPLPQTLLQQKPSTHWSVWHWVLALQAMPLTRFVAHTPPLQKAVVAHSPSVTQVVPQKPDKPPHTYGAHEGAPVAPAGRALQVPVTPERSHASQAPPHAVLQQNPSMH